MSTKQGLYTITQVNATTKVKSGDAASTASKILAVETTCSYLLTYSLYKVATIIRFVPNRVFLSGRSFEPGS